MSDVVTGTNRSSYQTRGPIENDEEKHAMKRDDYTSSASTSSSASTFSNCYDENEHNMWNPLLELFCHMEIGVRWRCLWTKLVQPELHSHAVLHSIFPCDKIEESVGYDEHELA